MSTFLVAYGTGEGQTAKIADRVANTLRERGHDPTTIDVTSPPGDLDISAFDAVVLGSSIHMGAHSDAVQDFVRTHLADLTARPTAFFQVSLSSVSDDEERQAEAARYVEEFLDATDWHPDRIARFGGALRYSKYGFLKRLMMKQIAKEATGDVDASRDYEYTDWDEVDAFTDDVAAFVEGRTGTRPDVDEPSEA